MYQVSPTFANNLQVSPAIKPTFQKMYQVRPKMVPQFLMKDGALFSSSRNGPQRPKRHNKATPRHNKGAKKARWMLGMYGFALGKHTNRRIISFLNYLMFFLSLLFWRCSLLWYQCEQRAQTLLKPTCQDHQGGQSHNKLAPRHNKGALRGTLGG